jgi:hypothetical protein
LKARKLKISAPGAFCANLMHLILKNLKIGMLRYYRKVFYDPAVYQGMVFVALNSVQEEGFI